MLISFNFYWNMLEMIILSSVGNSSLLDWQGLSWIKLLDIIFYAYFNKTFTLDSSNDDSYWGQSRVFAGRRFA
jgi:hypothetical protein